MQHLVRLKAEEGEGRGQEEREKARRALSTGGSASGAIAGRCLESIAKLLQAETRHRKHPRKCGTLRIEKRGSGETG